MNKFLPDIYVKSIYTVDYEKLKKSGIKCLLFDLDNTIATPKTDIPTSKIIEFFENLKDMGFKIIIISNSNMKRVAPYKNKINVDAAFSAKKPFRKKYKKVLSLYKFEETEIACIGDQLITDVYGANRMGFTSILVNPLSNNDYSIKVSICRIMEKVIYKNFLKRSLLKKGVYYD